MTALNEHTLALKRAAKHRSGGPWSDDDYNGFGGKRHLGPIRSAALRASFEVDQKAGKSGIFTDLSRCIGAPTGGIAKPELLMAAMRRCRTIHAFFNIQIMGRMIP
ncbi:MAG TPA: hypothetical protein VFJ59_07075 [Pseudolabrys sp.]|nr:hypothetical protein [Pseudolabrys sp.]